MVQGRERLAGTFAPTAAPMLILGTGPPPGQPGRAPQVGSGCQGWEGAETQACGRHLPAPAPFYAPAWEPWSIWLLLGLFFHIPFSDIFKRTPFIPLLPAGDGPSSPPHVLVPALPFKRD